MASRRSGRKATATRAGHDSRDRLPDLRNGNVVGPEPLSAPFVPNETAGPSERPSVQPVEAMLRITGLSGTRYTVAYLRQCCDELLLFEAGPIDISISDHDQARVAYISFFNASAASIACDKLLCEASRLFFDDSETCAQEITISQLQLTAHFPIHRNPAVKDMDVLPVPTTNRTRQESIDDLMSMPRGQGPLARAFGGSAGGQWQAPRPGDENDAQGHAESQIGRIHFGISPNIDTMLALAGIEPTAEGIQKYLNDNKQKSKQGGRRRKATKPATILRKQAIRAVK